MAVVPNFPEENFSTYLREVALRKDPAISAAEILSISKNNGKKAVKEYVGSLIDNLNDAIATTLKDLNVSQNKFAKRMGVDAPSVSRKIGISHADSNVQSSPFQTFIYAKLAYDFGLSVHELILRRQSKPPLHLAKHKLVLDYMSGLTLKDQDALLSNLKNDKGIKQTDLSLKNSDQFETELIERRIIDYSESQNVPARRLLSDSVLRSASYQTFWEDDSGDIHITKRIFLPVCLCLLNENLSLDYLLIQDYSYLLPKKLDVADESYQITNNIRKVLSFLFRIYDIDEENRTIGRMLAGYYN